MANTLDNAGILDTPANNMMIFDNLLEAAKNVTKGNTTTTSVIEGVNGDVKLIGEWKVLPNGDIYLSTVEAIPKF